MRLEVKMTVLDRVRNKLTNKVFNKLGSSLVWEPHSSSSIDKWGDNTITYGTSTALTAVPYNLVSSREAYNTFGDLQEGDTDMVVPYTSVLGTKDRITFNGVQYYVKQIEQYIISDGVVAYAVRLTKNLS